MQFAAVPTDETRAVVEQAGAALHGYLPEHAYVARMSRQAMQAVAELEEVSWVGAYHPAYRLEPVLVEGAGQLLLAAVEVSFPILVALLMTETVLALAARAAPCPAPLEREAARPGHLRPWQRRRPG